MNDLVYPTGCKPISDDLGSDELLRRLKVLAHTFQGFGQDANESYSAYIPLSLHLAEEQYLTHNSKDVQLLIACCIADIMRVYAPEAPYKDPIKIREIFEFIIKQLNGLKDPKDPAFKRYFYLLENLSFVKSFNMCFELEDNQEIFCSLFSLFFRIVSDEHSAKVKSYMLEILCPLISESDNVSTDLLDIILINICEPYKNSKKNAYQLAKELILRTQDTLEQYIKLFCNQVLVTDNLDKNYSIAKKIYDLIYELNVLSPQVLYSSLPQIEVKLKSSNQGDREKAVALIARMFSEPQSDLSTKYPHLWKIFLARFNDISIPIRLKCVQISMHFLVNHENTIKDITECLRQRQHDLDEGIRHQVVTSIVETAKRAYNVVASSQDLIEFVRERTLDKKYKIRKEALNGLAFIYKKYLMEPHNVEVHEPSMEMIKNKILHGYYMATVEDRILVERLLITCLVPYTQETEPRMKSLYHLLGSIDDNATKAFIELQKNQMKIRKLVGDWVKLHRNSAENNKPHIKNEINIKSQQISKTMPDPVKSLEYLTKFSQQMKSDQYTLRCMDTLLKKDLSCRECAENMSCILKKLGQPMQTNIYYNVVKMVLERMSSVMVDKESIEVLIFLIEECIKKNEIVVKEVRINADKAGVRGLQLLTVLSFCFAAYFQHEPILQHLLTLLSYTEPEYEYVVSYVLKIFTHLGKYVPLSKDYPDIFEQLVSICYELAKTGTPKQAKQAVRCIYVNAINRENPEHENPIAMSMFNELVEFLKIGLNPENENFRTAIVCMGHIAFHMPNKYTLVMKNFVARKFVKELLIQKVPVDRGDLPEGEWCTEEELPEITLCKLEAMKAMARWLTGLKTDVTAAEKTFRMLNAIIERGGDLLQDNILSNAEKSWIRLTAANAILKICEQKGVGDQIVAEQYFDLSKLMVDSVPEVREAFAKKLHKGLNKGIPHRCLPLPFMGFYGLAGLENDKRLLKLIQDFMKIDVNRRREYITVAKGKLVLRC
ncbi:PDS5A family protein [Megaselia abdita]